VRAGSLTFTVDALVRLGAHAELSRAAEGIARAVAVQPTSLDADAGEGVGGVGHRASWAAALEGAGQVLAGCSETTSAHRATLVNVDTSDKRVAGVAGLALADVAAGQVGAHCILSTRPRGSALVDVNAAGGNVLRVIGPSVLADAVSVLLLCLAVGVLAAGDALAGLRAADGGRTPDEGGRTGAGVGAKCILTDSVRSANPGGAATFVNIEAEGAGRCEASSTHTLSVLALGIVRTVEIRFAQGANFRRLAGCVGVAAETRRALALVAGVGVPADGVGAADIGTGGAFVGVGAGGEGVAGEAVPAGALVAALRVGADRRGAARASGAFVHVWKGQV
jgi:hypothetical protein